MLNNYNDLNDLNNFNNYNNDFKNSNDIENDIKNDIENDIENDIFKEDITNKKINESENIIQDTTNNILLYNTKIHDKNINFKTNIDSINLTNSTNFINFRKYYFIKQYIINCYTNNKFEIFTKFLSISLHIFIMIIFEIYFYFNYIVSIEKTTFLSKIKSYFDNMDDYGLNQAQYYLLESIFYSNNNIMDTLYINYINSLKEQEIFLNQLLWKACKMAGIVGIILIIFLLNGLIHKKNIKWRWILSENILMFIFLGIFEYQFFMNVVLKYSPITDAEIKYTIASGIIKYLNNSNT